MSQPFSNFTADELRRLERQTFVQRIEFHDQLDSTNNLALELARQDDVELPLLVLTEQQTAGRGRGSNRWWAARGALTFSILVETVRQQLPPATWPRISLSAGLAVCEALSGLAPAADLRLKWPNDVFLDGGKLCGILVEAPSGQLDRLVIGVGINVNNSFAAAPEELRSLATSLYDSTQEVRNLAEVLMQVLLRIERRLRSVRDGDTDLTNAWRDRCLLKCSFVRLRTGDRLVEGRCSGIDDDGALLIATSNGLTRHLAGVVEHFSP